MGRRKSRRRDYERNPLDYSHLKVDLEGLDPWQIEVMNYWGDMALRAGRQVGKSYTMAKKVALFSLLHQKVKILVSASSERQAAYLYEKIKFELRFQDEDVFAENPTMRRMLLKNGSEIYCLPTGNTGDLIRGLTLDVWVPDEASYIKEQVYMAVTPMLWVSKKKRGFGWIWALSTPNLKEDKFYEFCNDPNFKQWHIKSTECDRIPKEELERWKRTFTQAEYKREVLGEFVDEITRLFTKEHLDMMFIDLKEEDKKEILNRTEEWTKILGVDVARYGGDENAFVECRIKDKRAWITMGETTVRVGINETFKRICEYEEKNKYSKIILDNAGVGGALDDFLLEKYGNKILGINNASRAVTSDGKRKKAMKEDLYSNAIILIENGTLKSFKNDQLRESLETIQFTEENGTLKIVGKNSHLAEAFVRACWGYRAKGLKLFVHYF